MHKTILFLIIVTSIMLITVFGACFTASADGFGLIKVKATFMGIIPIINAEVWG